MNLVFSLLFHGLIVGALLYVAAREGLLGKQVKKIAVEMVKEKAPEKPKEVVKPKEIVSKLDIPKVASVARAEPPKESAAPPPSSIVAPPAVAPPAADLPSFSFEGGKPVITSSDPVQLYKGLVENSLRFNWERPKDVDDHTNLAEVEVAVNKAGEITSPVWKKSSGQKQWDDSVRMAIASTGRLSRPPPTNFPSRVVVRFDVEALTPVAQ
ncbi:MAG: TonB C-terminal domain-containing protein [Limisphaerales bacterium]